MPLASGVRIGPYDVIAMIGVGGMGEVYRARDMRLKRDVAIKVLPPHVAGDRERLARFEREAQTLAALSHPHIATIFGLEFGPDGVHTLVMELVEGRTLQELIDGARGSLPLLDTLTIARQTAEALEAAHEKGIVHRDLKPANIKLTPEGKVKVLDFGLAKAFAADSGEPDPRNSPTLSLAATRAGVILGTAAYMSPEQARGRPLDKRTDIWAFGCVLYEMLAGRPAFGGDNITDTLASVVSHDPDWSALPPATPPRVQQLLRRCLERDRTRRLRDIGDARIDMEDTRDLPVSLATRPPRRGALIPLLVGVLAGSVVAGVSVWRLTREPAATRAPLMRFSQPLPPGETLGGPWLGTLVELSPDGTHLVYTAQRSGNSQLYLRRMDQLQAQPIPGTDAGYGAFFSPDGQSLGFAAQGKLKRVPLSGGSPTTVCQARMLGGGSWGPDGSIIFNDVIGAGLVRVPASGGSPQALTTLARGENIHSWPDILPGGKAVVFTVSRGSGGDDANSSIVVQSLEDGRRRTLIERSAQARYAAGYLVFVRADRLHAVPFDADRLEVTGPVVSLVDDLRLVAGGFSANFSVSRTGSLVYTQNIRGGNRSLVWVDRQGAAVVTPAPPRAYWQPQIIPHVSGADGRRIALMISGDNPDIWIYEQARGAVTRLTVEPGEDETPLWSPDGSRIAYTSQRSGQKRAIHVRPADGSGAETLLGSSDYHVHLTSWAPDGKTIAYQESHPSTGWDIWLLPLEGDRKPGPLLNTEFDETSAVFSPDGRWLAYASTQSGRNEVYVQPYPGPGARTQISTDGGISPLWSRNGRELFYRAGERIMAISIETRPALSAGTPTKLFEGFYESFYDVGADGRFLMIRPEANAAATQFFFLLNWADDLRRRAR